MADEKTPEEMSELLISEIKSFVTANPLGRMTMLDDRPYFDEPLVQFSDGDDPIFTEYKNIIDQSHLTPREAITKSFEKSPEDIPDRISVISWILPISEKTRKSNYESSWGPSPAWAYTRWYGEKFNEEVRKHVVKLVTDMGHKAVAPVLEPYFKATRGDAIFSNWSERHMAFASGLGSFGLSDGFISDRGIAIRVGNVVADLELPATPRTIQTPYANCLFHAKGTCKICAERCPVDAITEKGHDKHRCMEHLRDGLAKTKQEMGFDKTGCGLCQTDTPCEFSNPVKA